MLFNLIVDKIKITKNPIGYWRKKGVKIGKNCSIFPTVAFGSEPYLVSIGDNVRLTNKVQFFTHDGAVWVLRNMYPELSDIDMFGRITVGNNVHIGPDTVIMPGCNIGNNCIIGVGSIVTKDIPDNSIAVGVPARVIRTIEEYKDKNETRFEHTKKMSREQKKAYLIDKYCK